MLVLERHVGESVILRRADTGELIGKVVLSEVRTMNKASIGFDLPRNVRIDREEVDVLKGGAK